MLLASQRVFPSKAVWRRFIHGSSTFNSLPEEDVNPLFKQSRFDLERLSELSNTSLKPFLNVDKISLLKNYCEPQNDVTCTYQFVIDENVAEDIVKNILTDDKQKQAIMVEGNPGLGLITLNLINSGVSHIHVFDNSEIQEVAFSQLVSSHPQKIIKKTANMHKSPECIILHSIDSGRQFGLPVTIFGVSTSFYFLRGLIYTSMKYQLWPIELKMYMVLSTLVWNGIREGHNCFTFPLHCLFRLLFTAEDIAKYPREAFLPFSQHNNEDMYLVRFSFNPDAFKIIQKEELNDYYIFLSIIGARKLNFIIPTLEKWLPNCGPYLISKGISLTTQVRDLSYEESILLYGFLKECEGYSDFKACASHVFSKQIN